MPSLAAAPNGPDTRPAVSARAASTKVFSSAGVHAGLDHLEGHTAAYGFLLLGHEHNAAATFADLLQQFVTTNSVPSLLVRRIFPFLCDGYTGGRFSQEISCSFMSLQQGFDLAAQHYVFTAGPVQIRRALRRRKAESLCEDFHVTIGRAIHVAILLSLYGRNVVQISLYENCE